MQLQTCLLTIAAMGSTFASTQGLEVDTSIGQIQGFIDPSLPDVKQWLGIPFAEPPIGPLRFLPPVAISEGQRNISAQKAPASCLQYNSFPVFSNEAPQFLAPPPYDEDCLYLNVIAPKDSSSRDLPVLFWIHGGATLQGGINTPYERPQQWVQRTQEHIVVQTK